MVGGQLSNPRLGLAHDWIVLAREGETIREGERLLIAFWWRAGLSPLGSERDEGQKQCAWRSFGRFGHGHRLSLGVDIG
jgi:hypothetical protein